MNLFSNFAYLFVVLICLLTCAQRGKPSNIEESNYLVSIYDKRGFSAPKYQCAGALISMKMVVTSGRCVHQLNKEITVVAGSTKLYREEHIRNVKTIFTPSSYSFKTGSMDIAVLEVNKPFKQGPTIHEIPLCTAELTATELMEVSGWGEAIGYNYANNAIQTNLVRKIPQSECADRFKGTKITVEQSMICSEDQEFGANFGGSGAPCAVNGELCAIALAKQKKETLPHLYTDLSNNDVRSFVQSTINEKCCSKTMKGKYITKISC